jgi:hypothetical protein
MINVRDKESGELLGSISEEELQVLIDNLEEFDGQDKDYWIDASTIEFLETEGAPATLIDFLRRATRSGEGVEVIWSRG